MDLSRACNYEDDGTVHRVTPFYTVPEQRGGSWEAECEGVRSQVSREVLPMHPLVTCVGVEFDETEHSMFLTFECADPDATLQLYRLLEDLSDKEFCTGLF